VELENGAIVIVVKGHASTSSWTPNFNFTVKLKFSLQPNGDSADLVSEDVSIDTSSWIINRFRGKAEGALKSARDRALAQGGARQSVRDMLSADRNLGKLLDSLIQPSRSGGQPPLPKMTHLSYSSIEIGPSGITLHGAIGLNAWPQPHVEFQEIPVTGGDRPDITSNVPNGPDYTALKTWIPGGAIQSYEWKKFGTTQQGFTDENRFVKLDPGLVVSSEIASMAGSLVSAYRPMCVTVHGLRLAATGPALPEIVSGTACATNFFPIFDETNLATTAAIPMMALVQPADHGGVEVVGHTTARGSSGNRKPPNLLVHFASREGSPNLEALTQAVRESERPDAPTAVMIVAGQDDLKRVKYSEDLVYSDDVDGWLSRAGLSQSRGPVTVLIDPSGKVRWKDEGEVDSEKLRAALRESLVGGRPVRPQLTPHRLRIGSPPPNFIFAVDKPNESTLRKLAGREVALVFYIDTANGKSIMNEMRSRASDRGSARPVILAISKDGSKNAGDDSGIIHVADPSGAIASAYGIDTWPTTVWLDERGLVSGVHIGRMSDDAEMTNAAPRQESER
jgi:hypothetical protein